MHKKLITVKCKKCEVLSDQCLDKYEQGERIKCPFCKKDMVRCYGFGLFKFKNGFSTRNIEDKFRIQKKDKK